jgi:hypothetical protein
MEWKKVITGAIRIYAEDGQWHAVRDGTALGTAATPGDLLNQHVGDIRLHVEVMPAALGRFGLLEPKGTWRGRPILRLPGGTTHSDLENAKAAVGLADEILLFSAPTHPDPYPDRKAVNGSEATVGMMIVAGGHYILLDRMSLTTVRLPRLGEVRDLLNAVQASGKPFGVCAKPIAEDPARLPVDEALRAINSVPYDFLRDDDALRALGAIL